MKNSSLNHENFTVQKDTTLRLALSKIELNQNGVIFVVDDKKVIGVLTDGDIRRVLIKGSHLEETCDLICQKEFTFGLVTDSEEEIQSKFNSVVNVIPVLDNDGNLLKVVKYLEKTFIQIAEPNFGKSETENLLECLKTGMVSSIGNFVPEFERKFNEYIGAKKSFAIANGTQALVLALSVSGIGYGDEVIVPDLTFGATANAVIQVGATPVIVDVDIDDWNIQLSLIKSAITSRTKAIIPVHLYGLVCQMQEIMELAKENNLIVIEDAAEALGSEYGGRKAGALGDFSIFSFYANKIITTGEGGMLCVNRNFDYDKILKFRSHGMSLTQKYWHDDWGSNLRLTNIQASIGVAQFDKLNEFVSKKRAIQKNYLEIFQNLSIDKYIRYNRFESLIQVNSHWLSIFHVDKSMYADLVKFLNNNFIETRPAFFPLHIQPAFAKYRNHKLGDTWNSIKIHQGGICLPSSTNLSFATQEKIGFLIRDFFRIKVNA